MRHAQNQWRQQVIQQKQDPRPEYDANERVTARLWAQRQQRQARNNRIAKWCVIVGLPVVLALAVHLFW